MELLEILIPVLFAVGYFIVSALQGKEEKGVGPERESAHSDDESLSEREREIQEEIRRKILERSGGQEAYDSSADEPSEYDPTLPDSAQRRHYRQETREIREYERPEQTQAPRPVYNAPETEWNAWEREPAEEEPPPLEPAMQRQFDDSQDRIRQQQESIEAMERRAEKLRKEADRKTAEVSTKGIGDRIGQQRWGAPTRRRRSGPEGDFRREVIASLKDQRSFKKAVLAYEILGTPVGLRRENKLGPLWSQQ